MTLAGYLEENDTEVKEPIETLIEIAGKRGLSLADIQSELRIKWEIGTVEKKQIKGKCMGILGFSGLLLWFTKKVVTALKIKVPGAGIEPARPFPVNGF